MSATVIHLSDRRPPVRVIRRPYDDEYRAKLASAAKLYEAQANCLEAIADTARRAAKMLKAADVLDGLPSDCEPDGGDAA